MPGRERDEARDARADPPRGSGASARPAGRRRPIAELEGELLSVWGRFLAEGRTWESKERFYALVLQWLSVHFARERLQADEHAYDAFVDRIIHDLPRREPLIPLLKAYWRRSRADACRRVAHVHGRADDMPSDLPLTARSPDPALDVELREILTEGLASVSPAERSVLHLRMQGYSYGEIASRLRVAPSTVRSLCSRGRKALSQLTAVKRYLTLPPS